MTPLMQWKCDTCGELINSPEDGYVEWLRNIHDRKKGWFVHGFRIVHRGPSSPRKPEGCFQYARRDHSADAELKDFLGYTGFVKMTSFIDVGPDHEPKYLGPQLKPDDIRPFMEFWRRLQLPYYEEARAYWHQAKKDDFLNGINEVAIFLPSTLKQIIEKYGDQRPQT